MRGELLSSGMGMGSLARVVSGKNEGRAVETVYEGASL